MITVATECVKLQNWNSAMAVCPSLPVNPLALVSFTQFCSLSLSLALSHALWIDLFGPAKLGHLSASANLELVAIIRLG